ncbi:MAG: SGNH/GDSL hydrolase family protein [Bacteroidetes bacterium]|nr:SGNH/GDSL hydrolase family protein [Bacteroidota bacterium]
MPTRRNFIQKAAIATLGGALFPQITEAANPQLATTAAGPTILFQGDSITDAGRDKASYYPNDASGMDTGYVHHIVTHLLGSMPEQGLRCYNRGISGHKVFQLADRWDDDCLQLKPDVLSILIGVNDYWHSLGGGYKGTVETYETDFRKLMERTKKALPETKLIVCEPFAVAGGTAIDDRWKDFTAYRMAAKSIAKDFGAVFVPFQSMFEEALKVAPAAYWCPDGVHPSLAGAYLMKEAWLRAFSKL